jgi:hypothetical protein
MGKKDSWKITDPKTARVIRKLADMKSMPSAIHEPNSFAKFLEETITAPWDRPNCRGQPRKLLRKRTLTAKFKKRREGPPEPQG